MASISGAAQRRDPRSGGKMVRPRRTMTRSTPYDRPRLLNSTHENPNWISRNIFSPTRSIVSGATRVLTSVFRFESSSSSSDSDSDSASDDTGGTNDDQDFSTQGLNNIEHSEPQSFAGKIETKRLIEQLLMQESFSREECDKLTNIIKSRVVDSPMIGGLGLERLNETPNRTDVDTPGTAVIKAKKWLEEKKCHMFFSGSNSKSELHHGTSALNFATLPHSVEGEEGSPVDVAKTYMRTRIPWASPSTNNVEFKSTSPFGVPLFKEETPYSTGGKYLSSSKKRDSSATCSWNIQEEIRKVRSKATEEMLRTLSSPKIDWSSFALEHKTAPDSLASKTLAPAEENNPQSSKKSVDASEDLATIPVSQIPENASNSDALPIPETLGCEENQGMEAVQSTEGKRGETLDEGQRPQSTVDIKTASNSEVVAAGVNYCKDTNGSILQFGSDREGTLLDSQIEDKSCLALREVAETGGASSTVNWLPSSEYSMQDEVDKEQNHGPVREEENTVGPGDENATEVADEDKGEASIEVAVANENDVALSESQHSSSMQFEDEDEGEGEGLPQKPNTRNAKRKTSTAVEKQQVKKVSKNARRGRGRVR